MLYFSALRLLFHDWPSLYSHGNIFHTNRIATQAHISYVMDFVFESIWIINQISVHTYSIIPRISFSLYWFHILFSICCGHKINKCYQWIKSNRSNSLLYWGFTDIWMRQNECVWNRCLGKGALHLSGSKLIFGYFEEVFIYFYTFYHVFIERTSKIG